jgi:hypothetical protein
MGAQLMPEPAEKAAAGLMSVVVFTAITALAIMVMLTVMGMLVTSLILTTWPGRRKCHALRMPAKRRRIIVAGSQAGLPLTTALATLQTVLQLRGSPRQRDRH